MQTFETTDPNVARRCRFDQHRGQKTSLTVGGWLVTGLVHSVMEVKSGNPTRWIIKVIAKPSHIRSQWPIRFHDFTAGHSKIRG
jgi:hypothetical protein